jgi:hypothetical protein
VITASEADFDAAYEDAIQKFYKKSDYDTAKSMMEEWFKENTAE